MNQCKIQVRAGDGGRWREDGARQRKARERTSSPTRPQLPSLLPAPPNQARTSTHERAITISPRTIGPIHIPDIWNTYPSQSAPSPLLRDHDNLVRLLPAHNQRLTLDFPSSTPLKRSPPLKDNDWDSQSHAKPVHFHFSTAYRTCNYCQEGLVNLDAHANCQIHPCATPNTLDSWRFTIVDAHLLRKHDRHSPQSPRAASDGYHGHTR